MDDLLAFHICTQLWTEIRVAETLPWSVGNCEEHQNSQWLTI